MFMQVDEMCKKMKCSQFPDNFLMPLVYNRVYADLIWTGS